MLNLLLTTIISALVVEAIRTVYSVYTSTIDEKKEEYLSMFSEKSFKEKYYKKLKKILDIVQKHFGNPFSEQSFNLNTNLAVFYSFALFFLIYVFTGYGNLGNLEVLNRNIPTSFRIFFLLLGSTYFIYLFSEFNSLRNKNKKKSACKYLFLLILSSIPIVLISFMLAYEWNGLKSFSLNFKTFAIISFAITLSAAVIGLSGDGEGSKKGFGALVFNITFISLIGFSIFLSSLIKYDFNSIYPYLILIFLTILGLITFFVRKKSKYLYAYNILLVFFLLFLKKEVPALFGMDIISASLLYFFVALPFINGLLDFFSLSVSRIQAKKIISKNNLRSFFWHFFLDLLIAFILLLLLIILFIGTTELFNFTLAQGTGFNVSLVKLFKTAIQEPLSPNGLWFYLMMFSTLFPTLIHLLIIVWLFFYIHPSSNLRKSIVIILKKTELNKVDKIKFLSFISITNFGAIFSVVFTIIIVIYGVGPLLLMWIKDIIGIVLKL